MTTKEKNRITLLSSIFFIGCLIILDLFYFMNGSLEVYPSEEQNEKINLVTILLLGILMIIEIALIFALQKNKN